MNQLKDAEKKASTLVQEARKGELISLVLLVILYMSYLSILVFYKTA